MTVIRRRRKVLPTHAGVEVKLGDCIDVLKGTADASVDSIVTDPPYGLEFMGHGWDAPWRESDINADAGFNGGGISATRNATSFTGSTNPKCAECKGTRRGRRDGTAKVAVCLCPEGGKFPNVRAVEMRAFQQWCELWTIECLRVLKPGGMLLAFGGTRTYHRLACAIEDTGFEIRDSISWLHSTGFPKSLDVSKAIVTKGGRPEDIRRAAMGESYTPSGRGRVNYDNGSGSQMNGSTALIPMTPEAEQWKGWGTALKPAHETIIVARRPLSEGKVAANVLKHGTGALNIDATRVGLNGGCRRDTFGDRGTNSVYGRGMDQATPASFVGGLGRWPANVVLSHNPDCEQGECSEGCPVAELDKQSGTLTSGITTPRTKKHQIDTMSGILGRIENEVSYGDTGGASRFYPVFKYQAKAPKSERPKVGGIAHSTVKPLSLMRWLVRLVTPPGGLCVDPFAGSGTTLEACILEGFKCIGIESNQEYLPLIQVRIERASGRH